MFPIHESVCHPTLLMRPSAFCVHRLIHFLSSPFRTGESSNDDQTAGFELHLETTPRSGFVAQLDGRERNWMVSGTWSPFKGRAEIVSQLELDRWMDGSSEPNNGSDMVRWSDGQMVRSFAPNMFSAEMCGMNSKSPSTFQSGHSNFGPCSFQAVLGMGQLWKVDDMLNVFEIWPKHSRKWLVDAFISILLKHSSPESGRAIEIASWITCQGVETTTQTECMDLSLV